jgi:cytochrome o ubiquinol oxidase subunit IV
MGEIDAARAMKAYAVGFGLALGLTIIPFGLVASRALSPAATLAIIAGLAVLQLLVHLRCFLHLGRTPESRDSLHAFLFAAVLVCIMIGGTLWIMFDLHGRMME